MALWRRCWCCGWAFQRALCLCSSAERVCSPERELDRPWCEYELHPGVSLCPKCRLQQSQDKALTLTGEIIKSSDFNPHGCYNIFSYFHISLYYIYIYLRNLISLAKDGVVVICEETIWLHWQITTRMSNQNVGICVSISRGQQERNFLPKWSLA